MTVLSRLLLVVAAAATVYSTAAFLVGLSPDFELSALAGIGFLAAWFAVDHVETGRRQRMTAGRAAVWGRRDRENGL